MTGEGVSTADGPRPADARDFTGGPADGPSDAPPPPPDAFVCPSGEAPNHVGELSEGSERWSASYETPVVGPSPPVVTVDSDPAGAPVGSTSIRLDCSTDRCSLVYPAALNAGWDLSGFDALTLMLTASNDNPSGWQEAGPQIRLYTSQDDYVTLRPIVNVLPRIPLGWVTISVPLGGDLTWIRQETGTFDPARVNALQIRQDTFDSGYVFWADGVTFTPGTFYDCSP